MSLYSNKITKQSAMKSLRILGMAASLAAIAPSAQAAQLRLAFDAFIPTARVNNPAVDVLPPFFTEFTGDNRDFDLDATLNRQARLSTQVVLDTEAPDLIVSSSTEGGTSVGFLLEDGVETSQSAQAQATDSIEATRISDREILLKVAARATNPLIDQFLPPDVEAEPAEYVYDIKLTLLEDGIGYDLTGTNRAYPSYSVFLNQTPILLNPADGEDPTLLTNLEPVNASGVVAVNEPANCLPLGLAGVGLLVQAARTKKR